jgi:uncharacterized membrane protein
MIENKAKKFLESIKVSENKKYTIYTENVKVPYFTFNKNSYYTPENLTSRYFDGFFMSYGIGYYKDVEEKSVKIEIVTDRENDIYLLIADIKRCLFQESVLLEISEPEIRFI